jgi:hypothetical protein
MLSKEICNEFHENLTKGLVAGEMPQKEGRTDVASDKSIPLHPQEKNV